MPSQPDVLRLKSAPDLAREAIWFVVHSCLALLLLAAVVLAITLTHPSPGDVGPKQATTILAFVVPALGGMLIARWQQNAAAGAVWIAGLLFLSFVCLWVLDLPTGKGMCQGCSPAEKLYRTFFSIQHGSGLMGGDGLLVGSWVPLSLFGYALGARFSLRQAWPR